VGGHNWQETVLKCEFDLVKTSWHSAEDQYSAGGSGEGAKKGMETEKNKDKSRSCYFYFTCDDVSWFSLFVLELNW